MPDYRETIIRIDHDTGLAEVWTPYPAVQRLMQRVGGIEENSQIGGKWYRVPVRVLKSGIRFGKRGLGATRKPTAAQLEATARMRAALRLPK